MDAYRTFEVDFCTDADMGVWEGVVNGNDVDFGVGLGVCEDVDICVGVGVSAGVGVDIGFCTGCVNG